MPTPVHLSAPGQTPERTWIEAVSPNYFALAGVSAGLGQVFEPGEGEAKGAAPTVVLSHRYWQRRFGGDPSIVGRADHPQRPRLHRDRRGPRELHRARPGRWP